MAAKRRMAFIVLFNIYFSSHSLAQKNFSEGYIITLNDDTLYGKVNDRHEFAMNRKPISIKFMEDNGKQKKYLANEIKGYSKSGIKNYISIRSLNEGPFFAEVLVQGSVALLFTHIKSSSSAGGAVNLESKDRYFLLHINEKTITEVYHLTFRKTMTDYFSDCKELKQKIEDKEFRFDDLEIIVKKYNECGLVQMPNPN